jgi:hypothetical protein
MTTDARPKLSTIERSRKLIDRYRKTRALYDKTWEAFLRAQSLAAMRGHEAKQAGDAVEALWRPRVDKVTSIRYRAERALTRFIIRQSGVPIPGSQDDGSDFAPATLMIDGLLWVVCFDDAPVTFLYSIDLPSVPCVPPATDS